MCVLYNTVFVKQIYGEIMKWSDEYDFLSGSDNVEDRASGNIYRVIQPEKVGSEPGE